MGGGEFDVEWGGGGGSSSRSARRGQKRGGDKFKLGFDVREVREGGTVQV